MAKNIQETYSITGIAALQKALDKVGRDVEDVLLTAAQSGALLVVNAAKQKAPYLSGNLKRSLHVGTSEDGLEQPTTGTDIGGESVGDGSVEVHVGTNVIYAHNHEFGTTVSPHPYLRPALDENRDKVKTEIKDAIAAQLRRLL